MNRRDDARRKRGQGWAIAWLPIAVLLVGCETDSYLNPSVVGRWERTPISVPILDRLDMIDEGRGLELPVTEVRPEDLIPDRSEYVLGTGDVVLVSIFELIQPGVESQYQRSVDETGKVRLPIVGPVQVAGLTPTQLEQRIREVLEEKAILRDATVSVLVQRAVQNTFSIIGEPRQGGTNVGTFGIPRPNFRLLDALALARGIPSRTKRLLILRQISLSPEMTGDEILAPYQELDTERDGAAPGEPPATGEDRARLIEQIMRGQQETDTDGPAEQPDAPAAPREGEAPPPGIEEGLEAERGTQWVNVGGEWVQVTEPRQEPPKRGEEAAEVRDALGELVTQRIIEIPYQRLLAGDMRYNVIIRPGDVIQVPGAAAGFVYLGGAVNRPGTFTVPGEDEVTVTQIIFAAGGLSQIAIPERTEIRRRISDSREAIVRINLRAIFEGTEPNIFLKPNDEINVGTNFIATPLAIFRNGLRTTYGFGFILDRNFNNDLFGEGPL